MECKNPFEACSSACFEKVRRKNNKLFCLFTRFSTQETAGIMFTKISAFGALMLFYSSYLARVNCQNKCLGVHNYCPGGYKMQSKCVDGSCVCNSQDYDYHSCLRKSSWNYFQASSLLFVMPVNSPSFYFSRFLVRLP